MDLNTKQHQLKPIYSEFETRTEAYTADAICKAGCAFCCTHYGTLDITTLEGWVIRDWILKLGASRRTAMLKKLEKNRKRKEQGNSARCPFLTRDNTCSIYDIRPFSCRQLYSLKPCTEKGPTVHRQVVELARDTVRRLQQLDGTGYSGHISYILHMFSHPAFRRRYAAGEYKPEEIIDFGKSHGLVINRMVSPA